MNYLAVLGRLDKISLAELESVFGSNNVKPLSKTIAKITTKQKPDLDRFGGVIKFAEIIDQTPFEYLKKLPQGKITFGISDYSPRAAKRSVWEQATRIKLSLKKHQRAVRIVPNQDAILSSATSLHNHLGKKSNCIEFILFKKFTAVSIGCQDIDAYAARDQVRPARDAKVGMLPPKLAQIIINCALENKTKGIILDPFCGTGVILQEALLLNHPCIGSDISADMIDATRKNLSWLKTKHKDIPKFQTLQADATKHQWTTKPSFVASEMYLGIPLSAPPSDLTLMDLKLQIKSLLYGFLKNIAPQIKSGATIAIAIPAWRRPNKSFSTLDIVDDIPALGYNIKKFKHVTPEDLLYYRENQVVARQIIVLRKK